MGSQESTLDWVSAHNHLHARFISKPEVCAYKQGRRVGGLRFHHTLPVEFWDCIVTSSMAVCPPDITSSLSPCKFIGSCNRSRVSKSSPSESPQSGGRSTLCGQFSTWHNLSLPTFSFTKRAVKPWSRLIICSVAYQLKWDRLRRRKWSLRKYSIWKQRREVKR